MKSAKAFLSYRAHKSKLLFSHSCQGDNKSAKNKRGYRKQGMSEVDICKLLLGYILVTFVIICIHISCFLFNISFLLCLVHTSNSMVSIQSLFI